MCTKSEYIYKGSGSFVLGDWKKVGLKHDKWVFRIRSGSFLLSDCKKVGFKHYKWVFRLRGGSFVLSNWKKLAFDMDKTQPKLTY